MTDWTSLSAIQNILIQYYFGDPVAYYSSIVLFFGFALVIAGLDFRFAIIASLPLVSAFVLAGVFGTTSWVMAVMLLLVAIVYGYVLIDLFT